MPAVETDVSDEVSSLLENFQALLSGERDLNNQEISVVLQSSQNEAAVLVAVEALPRFIASSHFRDWQAQDSSRAIAMTSKASDVNVTIPEILAADPSLIDTPIMPTEAQYSLQNVEVRRLPATQRAATATAPTAATSSTSIIVSTVSTPLSPSKPTITLPNPFKKFAITAPEYALPEAEAVEVHDPADEDVVDVALKHVDYLEIDRILRSGSWLFTFIASVENLPICITLSTARKDRIGFPLIYVNKFFEATSGYSRSDIMGANCKFLQRDGRGIIRSESDSVDRLSNALRNAEPIKVAITNFRRDGTPFKNLLAVKPVFSLTGEYEYVIGVQFDISSQRSSSYALRLVDALVRLLPGVVVN